MKELHTGRFNLKIEREQVVMPSIYSDKEVDGLFAEHARLVLKGHFDFGHGRHGGIYLNPHELLRGPKLILRFSNVLIDRATFQMKHASVIAGPWRGGAVLAHTLAIILDSHDGPRVEERRLVTLEFDETEKRFVVPRSYAIDLNGKSVWLVDDVSNTGWTLANCQETLESLGAEVVGTGVIMRRFNAIQTIEAPQVFVKAFHTSINYDARLCPMCKGGMPITKF